MGTNSLGEALARAEVKKATQEVAEIQKQIEAGSLPDLGSVAVVSLTAEQIVKQEEEAKKRREWVQEAAKKVVMARETVTRLASLSEKGPLSSDDNAMLIADRTAIKKIRTMATVAGCLDHFEKSVLLESIRRANADVANVGFFLGTVVTLGHYRVATDDEDKNLSKRGSEWIQGTLRFHGEFFIPCYDEDKSGYQKALEAELGKLVRRTVIAEKKAAETRIDELEKNPMGNPLDFKNRQIGTYSFYFPAGENKEMGRKWSEGAIVVALKERAVGPKSNSFTIQIVEIVEAVGRLAWLGAYVGEYVPYKWYAIQQIPDSAPVATLEFAEFLTKKLYQAVGFALKAQKMAELKATPVVTKTEEKSA